MQRGMIELEAPREKAVLVAAPLKSMPPQLAEEHLRELERLVDTAGADVVGSLTQRLDSPHPKYFMGEGKAGELSELVTEREATLVIFDEELSPAQGKNLEGLLGTRVMDRAEVILDIFATRARSSEAKVQVELAQLQYMLPRLTRMWAHLSRVRGGIGMRGPGETQLETDRRMVNQRIARLKEELQRIARQRDTQRKGREGVFKAALVGYTNAGKSSLLRSLSGTDAFVEDRLFATVDAATRLVDLEEGHSALVTDTVGFIRKLPHHLVASFRATLEETLNADLLLHVIDISHAGWEEQKDVVDDVLEEMELNDRPQVLVFNKVDRLLHDEEAGWRERASGMLNRPAVFVTSMEAGGTDPLRELLRERVRARHHEVDILVPLTNGGLLAEIYRDGEVLGREDESRGVTLRARIPQALLGRLRRQPGGEIHEGA